MVVTAMLVACAEPPPPRSVDEFIHNPIVLEAVLVRCAQNRAEMRYEAECVNAREASEQIAAREEATRREAFEKQSERKRQALRRAQEAAATARRRAEEERRRQEEQDYLAQFDAYAGLMPDRLRARFRMERLGYSAALSAVEAPARRAGRSFEAGVAEALVANLAGLPERKAAGKISIKSLLATSADASESSGASIRSAMARPARLCSTAASSASMASRPGSSSRSKPRSASPRMAA